MFKFLQAIRVKRSYLWALLVSVLLFGMYWLECQDMKVACSDAEHPALPEQSDSSLTNPILAQTSKHMKIDPVDFATQVEENNPPQINSPQLHPTQTNSIPNSDTNAESTSQESARSASPTEVGVGLEEGPEEQVRHLAPVQEEDEDVIEEEDVMNVIDEDVKRSGAGSEEQVQHLAPAQEEEKEEEVSSQPSPNTKLTQTQPPNPTTPDAPLVKCLQEIHLIRKYEDHEWAYDSNLSKWDLSLDDNVFPKPAKQLRYIMLYMKEKTPASRCLEYIEQLSLLNIVRCRLSMRIRLLWMWQGQEVFKLILIMLRIFDTPLLVIELAESLFDPNSIQTEEDPTELSYLLEDVPEKLKTRLTALLGDLTWTNAKWEKFLEVIKPTYPSLSRISLTRADTTQPNPTQPNTNPVPTP
ncbi:hypothetical protein NEHOM01_0842 [Nematocida homosporus]|uniref:uncharacterized protein n=1 Tax=Nematocida homosporus TaxID=1912981 RepID=UPI00221E8EB2|nr:uncharacterized protein NEHOM01_0842 [Nematocida homosporus]KAI5185483.1 hypothetical protein NEHOM01_0842 [Nematocida homosporus]